MKRRKWTREQREEARFRELVNVHRDTLKQLVGNPEKVEVLKKIARGRKIDLNCRAGETLLVGCITKK